MPNILKNFFSLAMITAISLSFSQAIQSMDDLSKLGEQPKKPSGIQLSKGLDETLEAVLGTGNGVMLKLGMDVNIFKKPVEEERLEKGKLEVPIRLFLTDFMSSPTTHQPVELMVKVDCESTSPTWTVPNKPSSFNSYAEFTDWLNTGYFSNQVCIAYDFHVDIQQSAPSLAQHLFAVMPGGYHFIGTYAFDNDTIKPDECVPTVSYASKRGTANVTTVTLGGTLYLNKKPYPVDAHHQDFPHQMISQIVLKTDQTKTLYTCKQIARSEVTRKVTYKEFRNDQVQNWPGVPSEVYGLVQQQPNDFENINHLGCFDGATGERVDITEDRVLVMDIEDIDPQAANHVESIAKDKQGNFYRVQYLYIDSGKLRPCIAHARLIKLCGFEHFPYLAAKKYDHISIEILERNNKDLAEKRERLNACLKIQQKHHADVTSTDKKIREAKESINTAQTKLSACNTELERLTNEIGFYYGSVAYQLAPPIRTEVKKMQEIISQQENILQPLLVRRTELSAINPEDLATQTEIARSELRLLVCKVEEETKHPHPLRDVFKL